MKTLLQKQFNEKTIIDIDITEAKHTQVVRTLLKDHSYEPECVNLVLFLAQNNPGSLFLNIGSNIGIFPLILGKFSKLKGFPVEIIAHEPLPELVSISYILQKSNNINYELYNSAISDFIGKSNFFISDISDTSSSLVKGFRKTKDVIQVDVNTLDSAYIKRFIEKAYSQIILMIDVETAEPLVLRGGTHFIEKFRPFIICEVLAKRTEVSLEKIFSKFNYIPYRYNGYK